MTDTQYGPDKPCRRPQCVADEPATKPAPTGVTANHLGGAHLNPADRAHYDGIRIGAMPARVREAAKPLLASVGAYAGPPATTPDSDSRRLVEIALDAAFDEIDRLRQQVAHIWVDADHKVRDASRRALDCTDHGRVITDLEAQVGHFDRAQQRAERARLALLGEHQSTTDLLATIANAAKVGQPVRMDRLIEVLTAVNKRAKAAHARAWKD